MSTYPTPKAKGKTNKVMASVVFTPLSFIEALVIALIFAAAVSTLGLIIGSIARTQDQAVWIAVFFTMVMVMLGGTFFEIPEGSVFSLISKFDKSNNQQTNERIRISINQQIIF